MNTRHIRLTMALIQARLRVLESQSTENMDQLNDDISDLLDEFAEKLEELLQLGSTFAKGLEHE